MQLTTAVNHGHRFGVRVEKGVQIDDEIFDRVQTEHAVILDRKTEIVPVKVPALALVHVGLLRAQIEDLVVVRAILQVEECLQILDLIAFEFDQVVHWTGKHNDVVLDVGQVQLEVFRRDQSLHFRRGRIVGRVDHVRADCFQVDVSLVHRPVV